MALTLADTHWNFTNNREWRDHFRRWPPVIISCAITGGLHGKEANPNLPESPEEQAESTYGAYKAGCTLVHIHSRDPKTNYATGTNDPADFYKSNQLVREKCPDIIINDTGGPMLVCDDEEVMNKDFAARKPEVASLDVGGIFLRGKRKKRAGVGGKIEDKMLGKTGGVAVSADEDVEFEMFMPLGFSRTEKLARSMRANGVKPELEVFSSQSWWFIDNLIAQDLVDPPYWCQLVFGQEGACSPPDPMSAMEMIANMPPKSLFSTIGIGPLQLPITMVGLIMGGHIRVGFEDNVYYRRGELAKSNAQLVERSVRIAHELNREIATPAQAREMLGLSATPRQYP